MKKMINNVELVGKLYGHTLAVKAVKNPKSENFGKPFIGGTIDIATDAEGLNVVTVNFSYVTPNTKSGQPNSTYSALTTLIEFGKTIPQDGMDAATIISIGGSIELNDFYTNRDGEETLVSAKRVGGSFVRILSAFPQTGYKNEFIVDMLINKVKEVEANPEKNLPERREIKGCVFNFRNEMLPIDLNLSDPLGISYFDSLELSTSNVLFTKVWGKIISQAIVETKTEEVAWGEAAVREFTRNVRSWDLVRVAKEPYEFADGSEVLNPSDITKAKADRETKLAEVKRSHDEYQANKVQEGAAASFAQASTVTSKTAAAGDFDF